MLKTGASRFGASALAVAQATGINLVELSKWNCCGTVYSLDETNLMPKLAALRNLVYAEQDGFRDLVTLCSMCYNTLRQTDIFVQRKGLQTLNDFLHPLPAYNGTVRVHHFLRFLLDNANLEEIKGRVTNPLENLPVALYYGCLLLRPVSVAIDDPENPSILNSILSCLGARPITFPLSNECCGAYQSAAKKDAVTKRGTLILESARSQGAKVLAVSCPLCHFNLSRAQLKLRQDGDPEPVSIIYFTELMALAMGLDYSETAGLESRGAEA